jgi:hypothetical protein
LPLASPRSGCSCRLSRSSRPGYSAAGRTAHAARHGACAWAFAVAMAATALCAGDATLRGW